MGTRHFIGAKINGEYKVAQYGQWDGYPDGQGADVLTFLLGCKMNVLKKAISECRWITNEEIDDINKYIEKTTNLVPKWEWQSQWPELSRDTGAGILNLILNKNKRLLKDSTEFSTDELFCEWAWIIDFDKNVFQGYMNGTSNLVAEFDLDNLPDMETFLAAFQSEDEEAKT